MMPNLTRNTLWNPKRRKALRLYTPRNTEPASERNAPQIQPALLKFTLLLFLKIVDIAHRRCR